MNLKLFKHKTVRFLIIVGLLLIVYVSYGRLTAAGKISPYLRSELAQGGSLEIAVHLKFKPEQFHINLFQQAGTVKGVQENVVLIARIKPEDVRRLARYYWINYIDSLSASRTK